MSCHRYAEAIADHACGGDLPPDAAAHLRTCAMCAALLDEQRATIGALDREIEEALAVEPSPYFVDRVQAHVRESAPAAPWLRWALAAAAVIVLAVIAGIAGTVALRESTPPTVARTQPPPAAAPTPTPATAIPFLPAVEKRETSAAPLKHGAAPPLAQKREAPVTSPVRQPEVIVPPDQARALGRYLALVRTGQVDTSTLTPPAEVGVDLVVAPLAVDPLAVIPLEPGTSDAGDRRPHE